MSHARSEQIKDFPHICSDCSDDEDFQRWIEGTPPTAVKDWPIRRQLGSIRASRTRGIRLGQGPDDSDGTKPMRIGVYWDGKLEEWLSTILEVDPDHPRATTDFQAWSFPTRRLLDEYLKSIAGRPESDVRNILRHLLFDVSTFGFDEDLLMELTKDWNKFEELQERSEYFRRLSNLIRPNTRAHAGVRWIIDLLPEAPSRAASVAESYVRAHEGRLPQGRVEGLLDAVAVINAYYIGNCATPWREALFGITPRQFECLVARLYSSMGFEVVLTPPSRDGGRDIEAEKAIPGGKQNLLIECKQYSGKVAVREARALLGVVSNEGATGGVLITTGRGTRGVHVLAQENARFDFVDGSGLAVLLNEHLGPQWTQRLDWLTRPL